MSSPLSLSDRLAIVPGYCELIGLGQLGYYLGKYIKHVVWDKSATANRAEDLAGMRKGFLHAIPVIGEIYAFSSCHKTKKFPTREELATLPIVQQILGIGTFLWHAGVLTLVNPCKKALYWSLDKKLEEALQAKGKTLPTIDSLKQMNWKQHLVGCGQGLLWILPGAGTGAYIGDQYGDQYADSREAQLRQIRAEIEAIRMKNQQLQIENQQLQQQRLEKSLGDPDADK